MNELPPFRTLRIRIQPYVPDTQLLLSCVPIAQWQPSYLLLVSLLLFSLDDLFLLLHIRSRTRRRRNRVGLLLSQKFSLYADTIGMPRNEHLVSNICMHSSPTTICSLESLRLDSPHQNASLPPGHHDSLTQLHNHNHTSENGWMYRKPDYNIAAQLTCELYVSHFRHLILISSVLVSLKYCNIACYLVLNEGCTRTFGLERRSNTSFSVD